MPKEVRSDCGGMLKSDMFAGGELGIDTNQTLELRSCARLFPHKGDMGCFFVTILQRGASVPRPLPQEGSSKSSVARAPGASKGGPRMHPLVCARYSRVAANDPSWLALAEFLGLDATWANDKLHRGLLFWQWLHDREQPERVALVSDGVARMWEAPTGSGKDLTWVRIGVFLFDQLPKNYLTGDVVPCRWKVTGEAASMLSSTLSRRRVLLAPQLLLQILQSDHRQADREVMIGAIFEGFGEESSADADKASLWRTCGGVLIGVSGPASWGQCWLPGVLTPRLLRLLVDDEVALTLKEALAQENAAPSLPRLHSNHSKSCRQCWAGCFSFVRKISR